MSSASGVLLNGNNSSEHDHILRPRAQKPMNPDVLRTLNGDGHLTPKELMENGGASGQTRFEQASQMLSI